MPGRLPDSHNPVFARWMKGKMYRMRQSKVQVSKSMAYSIMRKYPTAIQITMG